MRSRISVSIEPYRVACHLPVTCFRFRVMEREMMIATTGRVGYLRRFVSFSSGESPYQENSENETQQENCFQRVRVDSDHCLPVVIVFRFILRVTGIIP